MLSTGCRTFNVLCRQEDVAYTVLFNHGFDLWSNSVTVKNHYDGLSDGPDF